MKRLTFDILLAGTLAVAPLAWGQDPGGSIPNGTGSMQDRNDTTPPTAPSPGQAPDSTRRTPPSYPGSDPTNTRAPSEVPPGGVPTPSTESPSLPSPGAETGRATEDMAEVAIIQRVHEDNQKEIRMGQLAADKAKSKKVKSYARKLVSDHKAMDRQLMAYASKKGLDAKLQQVAAGAPAESQLQNDMHARLMGETGSEFDQDFMATMVDEHDKAIEMVRAARDSATDPELRKLLDAALPTLERHRKQAQEILDKQSKA